MIIETMAELGQADERSLRFTPLGFGPGMAPEAAAEYQQKLISRFDLVAQVPEDTRKSFERLRAMYAHGLLLYDLYTVVADQARLVMEQALRERFLPYYGGVVTFVDDAGEELRVPASSFDELHREIRRGRLAKKGWRLKLATDAEPVVFDGMLTSLLRWARAEGLLSGQQDRLRDRSRIFFRNNVAHPGYHLETADHAVRAIADLSAMINSLWGSPSGVPVQREVMLIAWSDDTVTWNPAQWFRPGPVPGTAAHVLVLADPDDPGLPEWDAQFETTARPCDYLWGPGTWDAAQAWLDRQAPGGDSVAGPDRLFLLQHDDKRLYLPRSPGVAAGLTDGQRAGRWYLLRADSPFDAFGHQRELLAGHQEHAPAGRCDCPVETIASGTWQEVLGAAAVVGADVSPRAVPDARVAISRMPRWNEIGENTWTVPFT